MKKSNSENKIINMFANQNILEDSSSLLVSDSFDFGNLVSNISNNMLISKFSSLGIILKNFLHKSKFIDEFSDRFFENPNFILQEYIFNKTSNNLKPDYSEKPLTKIEQSYPSTFKQPRKNSENNLKPDYSEKPLTKIEQSYPSTFKQPRKNSENNSNKLFFSTENELIKEKSQKLDTTNYVNPDSIDILPNFDEIAYSDTYFTLDPAPLLNIIPIPLSISEPIKIHVGPYSENITSQLHSDALVLKDEIYFSKDNFDLTTQSGLSLLVHEISHVQQYRNKNFDSASVNSSHEQEALENENQTMSFFKTIDSESSNFELSNTEIKLSKDNTLSLSNSDSSFLEPLSTENDMFFSINTNNQFIPSKTLYDSTSALNIVPHIDIKDYTSSLNLSSYSVGKNTPTSFTFHSSSIVQENSISNFNNSNLQSAQNQSFNTVPMTADENRNVQSTSLPKSQESPVVNVAPSINIEKIANQVFEKFSKQILLDRDRLGYR